MRLYFSRNHNPRLAVAVGRHLELAIDYTFAAPLQPDQQDRFRPLNPNLLLPILVEGSSSLWEADAIACRLSQVAGSNFWRQDTMASEMIRWISWGHSSFVAACDLVHFERVTKRRYGLGRTSEEQVEEGLQQFEEAASLLNEHLRGSDWLLTDGLSYADFRMACVLPFADLAGLPLDRFPHVADWHGRLWGMDAWRDPFAGLEAPELPPLSEK